MTSILEKIADETWDKPKNYTIRLNENETDELKTLLTNPKSLPKTILGFEVTYEWKIM